MSLRRASAFGAAIAFLLTSRAALATGFTDIGEDLVPRSEPAVKLNGYFRTRSELLHNLDLDRGLTPSGQPLFHVPLGDPTAQTLTYADMRLRTDVAAYAPGVTVAVKMRVDVLDNLAMGSTPQGSTSASLTQLPPGSTTALRLKRAYAEALTPVGLISAGRIGGHFGLGILANGGDCPDCDSGDSNDRFAFVTRVGGLYWAVAYDIGASGPVVSRKDARRFIDVEPSATVRTLNLAMLEYRDDRSRKRRRLAGKTTFEYGAYASHREQDNDVPLTYLPLGRPIALDAGQVMGRDLSATATSAWVRVTHPLLRVEAEWAFFAASIAQPSLLPGALFRDSVTATGHGGAVESEVGRPEGAFGAGIDLGYASGDDSPGFDAFPSVTQRPAQPGDLAGAKLNPPVKNRVSHFRFQPDYRIDRILFREIIGTVTGAAYARPHLRWDLWRAPAGVLTARVAAVSSVAFYPRSTPGGQAPLGLEIDPTLAYATQDGFSVALEYAVLFPFAGLDNPNEQLSARPAQLARARLMYRF